MRFASTWKQSGLALALSTLICLFGGNGSPVPPTGGFEELERALAGFVPRTSSGAHQFAGHGNLFADAGTISRTFSPTGWQPTHPNLVSHGEVRHPYPFLPTYPPELHYYPTLAQYGFTFDHPMSQPYQGQDFQNVQPTSTAGTVNPLPPVLSIPELQAYIDHTQPSTRPEVMLRHEARGPTEVHTTEFASMWLDKSNNRPRSRIVARVKAASRGFDILALDGHHYIYRNSPDVVRLTQVWKTIASLNDDAMEPIELSQDQMLLFNGRIAMSFRQTRIAKMVESPSGHNLMLTWHGRLEWIPQHKYNTMIVWEFGSVEQGMRTINAVGIFHLTLGGWRKMTPESIPGLRESSLVNHNTAMT